MHLTKLYRWQQLKALSCMTAFRNASHFKRSPLITTNDQLSEIKDKYFHNRNEMAAAEWQTITDLLLTKYRHINRLNVDAVIIGFCTDSQQLALAKSYIRYLKDNSKEPNDATLMKLLRIYNSVYHQRGGAQDSLTSQEQSEILEIYETIRSKHDVLDSLSCENLVFGLVATERWKDCLQLIEMMKITATPTLPAYTELIIKSFKMQDMNVGWSQLQQMLELRKQPKCEIFLTYLSAITNDMQTFAKQFEKLLQFIEQHNVVITVKVARAIEDISVQYPKLISAVRTKLKRYGKCSSCDHHLENVSLSVEDFQKLRDCFLSKVLIRNDIFQRSSPEEVKRFCDYVNKTGPYDCVIDGLNVAYSMGSKKPTQAVANLLANVVKHFRNNNKHVLVLGRVHMNKWPQKTMRYIKDNAALFLANDLSQDDPFLLYATLQSGQTTDFFSRDLMRQHAFILGPELKGVFRRWQQEHQYSLITQTESGKIVIKEPVRHLICAHKVHNTWHLPYKIEYSPQITDSFDIPENWLCIKIGQQ